jgi:cytochrome c553
MRSSTVILIRVLVLAGLCVSLAATASPQQKEGTDLIWAFPAPEKTPPATIDDTPLKQVPGSKQTYDHPKIDAYDPPDWFPEEHAPMPAVVQHGGEKPVQACDYCHLASGMGHPQSSDLAGIPTGYFVQQIADFKSGARTAQPMDSIAKGMSDEQVQQAAKWFASLKPRPWIKVVEADTVPKTMVLITRLRVPMPGSETEPLGNRIIEVPQEPSRAMSYDPHSGFIAYVPAGSLAKGKELVTNGGGGKTFACNTCHGEELGGMGNMPRIAGRSAISIFRQLYTIQNGTRHGGAAAMMKPVVENLGQEDMIAIAAYVASIAP